MVKMFWIAIITLETKVKVKYVYNQSVWIVMPTPVSFFDEGHSYLTHCLLKVCRKTRKLLGS